MSVANNSAPSYIHTGQGHLPEATIEAVWAACDAANVTEFIATFPNSVHTFIGESGRGRRSCSHTPPCLYQWSFVTTQTQQTGGVKVPVSPVARREGGEAVGRAEAAPRHRARDHPQAHDPAARRGDECAGLGQREGGAEGARRHAARAPGRASFPLPESLLSLIVWKCCTRVVQKGV